MRILIVSDSHGRNQHLAKALEEASPFDLVIHLGDLEGSDLFLNQNVLCPLEMISGNNDYFMRLEREKMIRVEDKAIVLTHGHRHNVHNGTEDLKEWARELGADIVLYGHTHIPLIEREEELLVLNPGSISQPRQEGHRPSYALMELETGHEIQAEIHYL